MISPYSSQPQTLGQGQKAGSNSASLSVVADDFDRELARLVDIIQRARKIGDSITGPVPVGLGNQKEAEGSSGLVTRLRKQREGLWEMLNTLDIELDRIEGGL